MSLLCVDCSKWTGPITHCCRSADSFLMSLFSNCSNSLFSSLSSSLNNFACSPFSYSQHLPEVFFSHFFLSFLPHVHFHMCLAFLCPFSCLFFSSSTNSSLLSCHFPVFCSLSFEAVVLQTDSLRGHFPKERCKKELHS